MEKMIPKIIHYCWFGNNEMPRALLQCIESWKKYMPEYEIRKCDETVCSFDDNDFVKKAYEEKRWAYVSDYYRLKVLYEYGGIYLDSDVRVRKSFDPLLSNSCFFNFIYDCIVGGGVIGATPHNEFIGKLISLYDNATFGETDNGAEIQFVDGKPVFSCFSTNNYLFTLYMLQNYSDFKLNNKYQDLGDFVVYPKEMFEIGSLMLNNYSIHLGAASWKKESTTKDMSNKEKKPFIIEYLRIIRRTIRYKNLNKNLFFYKYQVAQKKAKKLFFNK